jgi:hypothetical protein
MIGNGGEDAVDVFIVEEFFVLAGGEETWLRGDFTGEEVAFVVEVGCGDTFDAGKCDGIGEDAGTFHADADDAEAKAIGRRNVSREGCGLKTVVGQRDHVRGGERAGGASGTLQKLAAGVVVGGAGHLEAPKES